MRTVSVLALLALIGSFVLPQAVWGKEDPVAAARTQLTTARTHAGELAQRGTAISGTHLHLRHVINCLQGPQGKDFNAAAGNPCQGQGNGALVDLQTAARSGHTGAENALKFANAAQKVALEGLANNDINAAQPYALVVARQIEQALAALGR